MVLSFKSLSCLIFLSCYCSTGRAKLMEPSEAEQIALESSGELLAPQPLVQRIEKDLQAIRSKFSTVADVKHTPKWQPGKVIISSATKATIDKIQSSSYGPVEARAIFQDIIYVVTFTKPYNPEKLAEVLEKELGVTGASPDGLIGGSSSITLTCGDNGVNTYVFFIGSGDCPAGCINRRYLTFTVDADQKYVQLVKDSAGNSPDQADQPMGVGLF